MKTVGVIPARYGSLRLPGKPLADICGRPMVWWVYERVKTVERIQEIYVATDDERIAETCRKYGIPFLMTSDRHTTAACRLQEVSEKISADFYLQINGDEPLIDLVAVERAIPERVPQEREFGTNLITEIWDPSEVMDSSNIKVVFDDHYRALYMSRTPVPYPFKEIHFHYYKHVGIIGYNKKMLDFYAKTSPGYLERIEGIDTMRFLDYGKELKLIPVEHLKTLSVDTQKDLDYVRQLIKEQQRG